MSAAAPANAAPAGDPPMPARGKKKLILIVALVLLVLAIATGAAVFVLKKRAAAAAEEAGADGAPTTQERHAKDEHRVAPTFVPLEPFVVNLADKDTDRYAQIGLTLEVDDAKFAEEMKLYMPAVRNAILMILAHKRAADLLERSGKQALAAEIMREAVRPMGIEIEAEPAEVTAEAEAGAAKPAPASARGKAAVHNPVRKVHYSSFIVQ